MRSWTRSPWPRGTCYWRPSTNTPTCRLPCVARLAEEAQDLPDLSGFPVVWHDPADAVATIDVILSALASPDLEWDGWDDDPGEVADCLKAIRQTLQQAVMRQTRFNFIIA